MTDTSSVSEAPVKSNAFADFSPPPPAAKKNAFADFSPPEGNTKQKSALDSVNSDTAGSIVAGAEDFAKQRLEKDKKLLTSTTDGKNSRIDYTTGLPYSVRADFIRADNDAERTKALLKSYPNAKVYPDPDKSKKDWIVETPDGKKTEVLGKGFWKNLGTDIGAKSTSLGAMGAGGWAGAVLGSVLGPAGTVAGGVTGAGIGQALGKLGEESVKAARGLNDKTLSELFGTTVPKEINEGMMAEAGGQVLGKVGGTMLKNIWGGYPYGMPFLQKIADRTKEMTARSLERGLVPNIGQSIPFATFLSQKQIFLEKVLGSVRNMKNAAVAKEGLADLLQKAGVAKDDVEDTLANVLRGNVDYAHLGDEAGKYYKQFSDTLTKGAEDMKSAAEVELKSHFDLIDRKIVSPDAGAYESVTGDIIRAADTFSEDASRLYAARDELTGNKPILNTAPIVMKAKEILAKLPKTKETTTQPVNDPLRSLSEPAPRAVTSGGEPILPSESKALTYLQKLVQLPGYITFGQAQILRSQLFRDSYTGELTNDLGGHFVGELGSSADEMFVSASEGKGLKKGFEVQGEAAAKALRKADDFYKEGITKFKDVEIARLGRDAVKSGAIKPENVIPFVADPKYASRLNKILDIVTPQTRQVIARGDFDRMVSKVTNPALGTVSAPALLKELEKRSVTGPKLWGDSYKDIVTYAKRLGALDGTIDKSVLDSDTSRFAMKLRSSVVAKEQSEAWLKTGDNYLAELGKTGFLHDDALALMVKPGETHRLEKAIATFKGTPVEKELKVAFMKRLFSSIGGGKNIWDSTMSTTDLNTHAFSKEVSKYTDKQLNMLLGPDLAKELRTYAEDIDFTMNVKLMDIAAALAGGAAKLHLAYYDPSAWPKLAAMTLGDWFLSRPGTLRWLAVGKEAPSNPMTQSFEKASKVWIDNYLQNQDKKRGTKVPQD